MLTRIFTILAVISGLAIIGVTQFMVRPHIEEIVTARDDYNTKWKSEKSRAARLEAQKRETEEKLVATETELKDTQSKLEVETTRANTQEQLANKLQTDLNQTRARLTAAEQELGAWGALGLAVDQVKALIASEKNLREINEVLEAEKVVLTRVNRRLKDQLDTILGERDLDPPLPPGTKGTVLVVDPKWKFVVLDIGESHDIVPNGVLMVSREGKLVAKVRVMSVYSDRSIANVLPGWDFGEIVEGDQVLY